MGWVWAESTLNQFRPQPWTLTVLNVADAADEDRAFDPIHLRYVMPGAAYRSVCELSRELNAADLFKDDATNQAIPVAHVAGTAEELKTLFAVARSHDGDVTTAAIAGKRPGEPGSFLKAAIRSGQAAVLTAALRSAAP